RFGIAGLSASLRSPRQTRLPQSRSQITPAWPIPIGVSAVVPLTTYSYLKSYAQLHLILSAFDPDIATEVEATSNPPLLEREDCTGVRWCRCFCAPRAGGAYDSHHRTAGIASRTRRRGGYVAARGAGAAAAAAYDAGDRISQRHSYVEPRSRTGVGLDA